VTVSLVLALAHAPIDPGVSIEVNYLRRPRLQLAVKGGPWFASTTSPPRARLTYSLLAPQIQAGVLLA